MYTIVFAILAVTASTLAVPKPGIIAPVVQPAVVTAQSSQFFTRSFNGLAVAPFLATPVLKPVAPVPVAPAPPVVNDDSLVETFSPDAKPAVESARAVSGPLASGQFVAQPVLSSYIASPYTYYF